MTQRSARSGMISLAVTGGLLAAILVGTPPVNAATTGPCDIYAAAGTPCVAAHSTTRALLGSYSGSLYQVRRSSDGTTRDIGLSSPGGVADAAAQDAFCVGATCLITVIYDQTSRRNHLTQAPPGAFPGPEPGGHDSLAVASAAPVTIGGRKAYGVLITPGTGYRNNKTNGIATGDQPEGIYAVLDGTNYNDGCCFDYGNAETNSLNNGNGTMEAVYFGNNRGWGSGAGNGPWVMADLENGLFSGINAGYNANSPTVNHRFLTAIVKGEPNHWSIRAGDAQAGGLSTHYDGPRPNVPGYNPMRKEGAIILGIGGDNSPWGRGTFYEGVMTSGYPAEATENAVQANIAAAGYEASEPGGPVLTPGSRISLQATSACCTDRFISHAGNTVTIAAVNASSSAGSKAGASWIVRPGLSNSACRTFESADTPGAYLRHSGFRVSLAANDGSALFAQDATFCSQPGRSGRGISLASANYPSRLVRHFQYGVHIASNGGPGAYDSSHLWADDVSWVAGAPWAP